MSLQVEKLEKNMAKLTIEVSAQELEAAIQSAYQKNKKQNQCSRFQKRKSSPPDDRKDVWKRNFL